MTSWQHHTHPDDDPTTAWLRQQIEDIFTNHPTHTPTTPQRIPQIAALATVLTFLTLMITMALTAAPPW